MKERISGKEMIRLRLSVRMNEDEGAEKDVDEDEDDGNWTIAKVRKKVKMCSTHLS